MVRLQPPLSLPNTSSSSSALGEGQRPTAASLWVPQPFLFVLFILLASPRAVPSLESFYWKDLGKNSIFKTLTGTWVYSIE